MASQPKKSSSGKNDSHVGMATVIGGLAAAAAVGGYYLYHNKDAQKKLKHVRGWMVKAKGEVLEKIENLKEVNQDAYHKVIDAVLAKYTKLKNIDTAEIAKVSTELKSHWKTIQAEIKEGGKKVSGVVKTVAKDAKKVATAKASSSATATKKIASKK